ncbi:MAG: hypothetical protein E7K47_13195, partial [Acidovorax sp.]|nr:hypothetical protein [Acidovorax sp.]
IELWGIAGPPALLALGRCVLAHMQGLQLGLNLPPPVEQLPATETSSPPVSRAIRVDVRRSASVVTVNWPLEDAASCAAWLRDWLR